MEVKERKKVESCKSIETKQQLRWESHKVFETDAPKPGTDQWKQVNKNYRYSYRRVPFGKTSFTNLLDLEGTLRYE